MTQIRTFARILRDLFYRDALAPLSAIRQRLPYALIFCLPLLLTACREGKVTTYRIPKENSVSAPIASPPVHPPVPPSPGNPAAFVVAGTGGDSLVWTAPVSWSSKPASAMRKATYIISGDNGTNAELSITAFPGSVGGELANVNRWRAQLQLPAIADAELAGAVSRLTLNGLSVTLVELTSSAADHPQGLIGAIVPVNGANWFFKLTGPATMVAKEKPAFNAFLQTVKAP